MLLYFCPIYSPKEMCQGLFGVVKGRVACLTLPSLYIYKTCVFVKQNLINCYYIV